MKEKRNYLKSPISYMGNKHRLLPKLEPMFPKDINLFIDVFGGSGVMSLNIGQKALYNEIIPFTKSIVELAIAKPETLKEKCHNWFVEYNLYNDRSTIELEEQFKVDYNKFRDYVNNTLIQGTEEHVMGVYGLHVKAINNLIRFNKDGKFNASAGFKKANKGSLTKLDELIGFKKNIQFESRDFSEILNIAKLHAKENTFIYFDPPYLNTTAVYNEKRGFGGWDINEDYRLFENINQLKENTNIKWAYSNTLVGKNGEQNTHIKEWADKNGYYINYIDKKYHTFGYTNTKNVEVLITNYKIGE